MDLSELEERLVAMTRKQQPEPKPIEALALRASVSEHHESSWR